MTRIRILGTGNAQATNCYNTCLTIENEEGILLVDAGGGNGILKILEDQNIPLSSIHDIFVTHAHTDHIFGVIWLIRRIGETMAKGKYEGNLTIYCHKELADLIEYISRSILTKKVISFIGERIIFSVHESGDKRRIIGNDFTVFDIGSTKARQFGFCMEYDDGKRFVCCGDEPYNPCEEQYARGCDWLLHEAFCLHAQADVFHPYEKHHSTVRDACMLASELGAKNLLLYHTEDRNLADRRRLYTEEGVRYYSGGLYVPDDLDVIRIS